MVGNDECFERDVKMVQLCTVSFIRANNMSLQRPLGCDSFKIAQGVGKGLRLRLMRAEDGWWCLY